MEGSQLGLYLRTLKINGDKYDSLIPKISQKSSAAAIVKKKPNLRTNDSILIAVATSRKMLSSRVVTIANTWAKPEALTPDITVLFFVGRYDASSSYQQELFKSGSRADRTILAQQAGLNNFSSIIVMPDAEDDEYPPVYKNTAMLKYLDKFITVQEKDASQQGNTWVFKVDDDTYVNTKGLRDFLQSRESTDEFQIWGERGSGRKEDRDSIQKAGLVKPFCMGGPGYIMSRSLLRETVRTIETCIDNARTSIYKQYIWHSDLIISLCAYNKTGVGCYEASDYYSRRPFRHNYKGTQDFVDDGDLSNIVSMHPFKESAEMMRQHARFLNLSSSKNEDQSLVLATNGTARPLFVLHAGPPKTGTTTIQCTASSNLKSLLQDNVYFLGYVYHEYQSECGNGFLNNEVHKIVACLYEDKEMDTSCATQLQSFLDALEAYRIKNRNVFVSDELFFRLLASGHTDNKALHTMRNRFLAYLGTNWDLRVVVSYRRLHERGPSEYFQIYDKKLENINEKWPERKDRNYKSGRSIPSFLEYHRSGRILTWANKLSRDRMVENLLGDSDFRVDFRIFNIHETNEDLGARFFCEMIPEAKELCQKLEHQETHFRMNQAARKESFVYDRLAVAAFHRGWVDKNASRIDLREAIKKELQKTPSEELPLECLSSEEAVELLDASLALESQLLPDFFDSPRGQPRLRLSFENMLKDHKFCSADVEKILDENKKWETFLRSISRKLSSQQGKLGLQQYYVTRATKNEGDDQHKNISQTSIFKNTIPRDMILLHKKLLWCPNAKAGTSTMYYSILNFKNRTPKNESVWKLFEQNEETRELVRKAPSFTIVRNPWDRLRSCYLNKILGQKLLPTTANPGGEVKTANPGGEIVGTQDKSMSFSAFVRHVEKYPDANVHWQPHSSRCLANANKYGQIFHYDHVVKIEDGLFSQVQEIFELYGLPFPGGDLKKRNAEATSPNVSDDELINFYRQAAATGNVSMKDLVDSVGKIYEHDVTSHRYEFPGYDENKNK